MFQTWLHMTEQGSRSQRSESQRASESPGSFQQTEGPSNTHTHAHAHAPQIEQTGNSHSVKSRILHVSTQTTSSVISLVFEEFCSFAFCLCVWFIVFGFVLFFSLCVLFTLVFSRVMTASCCLQRPFLSFSKSTKKIKRAEAVSVASPQSVQQPDKVRPTFSVWSCKVLRVETQKSKSYLPKQIIPESLSLMESISVHILKS